ncbi:MAG: NADP-dependent 3-hydroxy acid dehydrogenase YdfG [Bradymonadia bacterium]|jgi:NADP-dependent 3-hydroxy acid dehydrogenase YdfG
MALEFARQGANVAVSGRRLDRLQVVADEVTATGREGMAIQCDVTDEAAVEAAVSSLIDRFGQLDVVVANAGFAVAGNVTKLSAEDWRRQFDVNVVGAALTAKYSAPELEKTNGRLALIGSVAGTISMAGTGAYSASKYAVRSLAQTLALELHSKGISVTLVQPGFVKSEIAQVSNEGVHNPNRKDRRPAKLMWEADDAARVIVRAVYRRKREFTFTAHGKLGAFLGTHMPGLVHFALTRSGKGYDR